MNPVVTSKQEILQTCQRMIREQGWSVINIRNVASACGVSVGSIYNYFSNKSELNTAVVESIWRDIFNETPESMMRLQTLSECIQWIYDCMEEGERKYPQFYSIHSMSFSGLDKNEGQSLMFRTWGHIKHGLVRVIKLDNAIKEDAFDASFTPDELVEVVFSYMIASLVQRNYNCVGLIAMVNKLLY